MAKKEVAYQDGSEFYDEATGECIASYPDLVAGDDDLDGAQEARKRFLSRIWGQRFTIDSDDDTASEA